jgi:hypothetical protein
MEYVNKTKCTQLNTLLHTHKNVPKPQSHIGSSVPFPHFPRLVQVLREKRRKRRVKKTQKKSQEPPLRPQDRKKGEKKRKEKGEQTPLHVLVTKRKKKTSYAHQTVRVWVRVPPLFFVSSLIFSRKQEISKTKREIEREGKLAAAHGTQQRRCKFFFFLLKGLNHCFFFYIYKYI